MSVNFSNTKIFDGFLKKSGTSFVSVYQPACEKTVTSEISDSNDVLKSKNSPPKKKIFGIIGLSVGSAALLGMVAVFTLSKGFSAGLAKKFSKISNDIKNIVAALSQHSKELSVHEKVMLSITKKIQSFAELMEASANITAIKDSSVNKLLNKLKLQKFVAVINTFFKDKIVLTTKNNAYKRAELSVVEFCNFAEKVAVEQNNKELLNEVNRIMHAYSNKFSVKSHVIRTDKNWHLMDNLSEVVFERLFKSEGSSGGMFKKILGNVKQLKSYLTISLTENQRNALKSELAHSSNDLYEKMRNVKGMVPENQKGALDKLYNKAEKHLSKAIASEIKAFNKLAEIQVGSVATDIMGIIVPSTIAAGLIINSENKNERIGTALTKGIPIFGGLGVSYYGSTRGFTGAKNLGLGLSTAFFLNIIGTRANEWYKNYYERQHLLKKAFETLNKLQAHKE